MESYKYINQEFNFIDIFKTEKGKNMFLKLIRKWYDEDSADRLKSNWVISKLCFYKKNKMLRFPYNNITYLMNISLKEIDEEIAKIDVLYENKQKEIDIIVHFENDEIIILTPLTYESAKKYGSNTRWCVSSRSSKAMYDILCTKDNKCYMFCSKINEEKYILYVHNGQAFEFTDKEDNHLMKIDYLNFLNKYRITNTFCSLNVTCYKKDNYLNGKCFYCNDVINCDKRELDELKMDLIQQREIYII